MNAKDYRAAVAEHQRVLQNHKQALKDCWQTVQSFRARLEVESISDRACEHAGQVREKFTCLSAAANSPARRHTDLLHLMARLDQAEAAAMEIILADAGPRMDALAELIANVVVEAHATVSEGLDRD